jgi:hypothetical protein
MSTDIEPPIDRPPTYAIVLLATLGLLLFALDFDPGKLPRYAVALAVGALTLLPGVRDRLATLLDRLRSPSPRAKGLTFVILFALASWYFLLSATLADRGLFPMLHDEYMYLLQARLLASGRLWMPRHPLGPFFESFNVVVDPVYAATYFPGTAVFHVPGMWLGLPPYATSVAVAALAVAMLFLVMTDLFDGVAGLLAALSAVALVQLRVLAVMTMSHPAMLLLLLLAAWSYARWRRNRRLAWAAAFGGAAGWAAVTRPLDAACLVGALCLPFAWDALRHPSPRRRALATLATLACAAAPFLALQLALDKGVTGHFLRTPFTEYARATFPGLGFGARLATPLPESASPLPQVRDYYRDFLRPDLVRHARTPFLHTWIADRLAPAADVALPAHALLILLPLGLLTLRRRHPPRAALAAGVLTLPLAYAFYPSYLQHYGLVCAPAFLTLVLGGEHLLRRSLLPRPLTPALPFAIAALCLASLPELRSAQDPFIHAPYLADVNDKLAHLDHVPAVVLFHYDPNRTDVHEEPVYNLDTPNPDDAPIIRAQDLGPAADQRIFGYYAQHQPNRFFYLYSRTTAELTPLGYARDLAKK